MMYDVNAKQKDTTKVVEKLNEFVSEGKAHEIFCVAFDIQGTGYMYYSGQWHNLAKAAAFLNYDFNARMSQEESWD